MVDKSNLANSEIWPLIERVYDFVLCFEVDTGLIIRKSGFDKVCVDLDSHENFYPLMEQYRSDYVHGSSLDAFYEMTALDYIRQHEFVQFVGLENIENNEQHWYEYIIAIEGNVGIMLIHDIHSAHCRMLELEEASTIDYLTGLANRRSFGIQVNKMIEKQEAFTLLFIDVDDFKSVNDTYGHNVGDCILKEIGKILTRVLPEEAVISRYGGDEFAVVISPIIEKRTFKNYLEVFYENLNRSIECGKKVDVSIGIVDYPANGQSLNSIVESADKALYCAKSQGKGRYVMQ